MLLLIVASPTPSPINVNVNVPPDTALDRYTLALAIATDALAVFTIVLAIIGGIALRFQRREIHHVEDGLKLTGDQLRLARDDFDARARAARPLLTVSFRVRAWPTIGDVEWVQGSEPAFEVKVWARGPTGYHYAACGTL
jgi:hypothetical protein